MKTTHLIIAVIIGIILSLIPYNVYVGEEHYDSLSAEVWRRGMGVPFGSSVGLRSEGYPYERHETLWLTFATYDVAYLGDKTATLTAATFLLTIILNTLVALLVILTVSYLVSLRKI